MGKAGSRVIRGSTGRFLTLVLAPLVVVGVTAIVMLPRGGDDKVKVNADGPVVNITSPQTKSRFNRNTIQIVARVSDPDGLATAELRVQGKRVATISLSGASDELASFNWEASEIGEYEVAVRARDLNGSWGEADEITISIEPDSVDLPPPPTTIISNVGIVDTTPTTLPGVPTDPAVTDPTSAAGPTSSTLLPPLFPTRTNPGTARLARHRRARRARPAPAPRRPGSRRPRRCRSRSPAPTDACPPRCRRRPSRRASWARRASPRPRNGETGGAARPDHHLDAGGARAPPGPRSCRWSPRP